MRKFYLLVAGLFLCGLAGAQELAFRSYPFPNQNAFYAHLFLDGKDVWIATIDGAYKFSGGAWEVLGVSDGLPSDSVAQISKDIHGNHWFTTDEGPGVRRPDQSWEYPYPGHLGFGGMVKRVGDDLWLSLRESELLKIDPAGATTTYDFSGFPFASTRDIERDAQGTYYAIDYQQLYKMVDDVWEVDARASTNYYPTDIMITRNGVLYYATQNGVLVDRGGASLEALQSPYFQNTAVESMAEGRDGTVYFATSEGLVTYKNEVYRRYDASNGLAGKVVKDVGVDDDGNVWCTVHTRAEGHDYGPLALVVIPYSLSNDPTYVHGIVFHDLNHDGVQGQDEPGVANQFIHLMPRDGYAITNQEGKFLFPSEAGENTLTWQPRGQWEGTTDLTSYTFTSPQDDAQKFSIGIALKPVREMVVFAYNSAARPGFIVYYDLMVMNHSAISERADVTFTFDPALEYLGSDIAPTEHNSNTLRWTLEEMETMTTRSWEVSFRIPATTRLGKVLSNTLSVPVLPNETNTSDNSYTFRQVVTGSYDPNDKLVTEGILEQRYVEMGTPLSYTIRFQNTGTDTAFTVRVTDEIDPKLDIGSLEVLRTSHPAYYLLDGRTLTFHFENILLPDSTRDEPNSHGYIQYRIQPIGTMGDGTQVRNKASIYFDFNEPVVTNETVNTYVFELPSNTPTSTEEDMLAGVTTYPNPVRDGNLVIVSKNEEVMKGFVTLTSLAGSTMRVASLHGVRTLVDVKGIAPGMYVLRIDNRGVKSTRKVVIGQE